MRGDLDEGAERLRRAVGYGDELGNHVAEAFACGELAVIALRRSDLADAATYAARAHHAIEVGALEGYPLSALALASAAHLALLLGDRDRVVRLLREAHEPTSRLTVAAPHLAVQARIELTRCAIGLGHVREAQMYLDEANEIVAACLNLGVLVDELREIEGELRTLSASGLEIRSLTPAELRVLPLLTTHLSFREIGERLFVSQHTVKTHAISIYRKLGATSRASAVQAARRLGLLGS
jgi:LuxR family maltose regulon positive regulatory protein